MNSVLSRRTFGKWPSRRQAADKYAWLDDVVAVGVYRPGKGKVAYRIYQIL